MPNNKIDATTIAKCALKGIAVGLLINGFFAGVRVSSEYGESTQDLDFSKKNCTAAFKHEQYEFKKNFVAFWACLGVGFIFGTAFFLGQALQCGHRRPENARLLEERTSYANSNNNPNP